ncbi:hypothetical protein D3C86_1426850 [compost metagenome]
MGDRAVFVDSDAQALHRPGQPPYQSGRVNGRHVRRVDTAVGFGDADLLRQLFRGQPAIVAVVEALAVEIVQVVTQAGLLLRIACGAIQHPAFTVVAVDSLTFEDNFHFIRNAVQQIVGGAARFGRQFGQQAVFSQQIAHQPATIAPRRAETGGLRFDDGDVQVRFVPLEVVRGPESGITRADDRHVDIQVPLQRRTRQ